MAETADVRLARVARAQYGAFTREQARDSGLSRGTIDARLRSGQWRLLHLRVYCAAAVCDRPETRALAGLLFCGAGAAFSHLTAARLHGISLRVVDPRVWLSVPAARVVARRPDLVVTRSRRLLGWVESTRGQPVTTLPRTILDLAQVLDEPELSGVLYDVVRREPTIVDRALAAAEGMGGRAGIATLRRVAASFDPAYESAAEARAGGAFAEAGILLTSQVEVWDGWRLVARLDFADEDLLLVAPGRPARLRGRGLAARRGDRW